MEESLKEDKIMQERKDQVISFFKNNPSWIFYVGLIVLIILGIYIRYLPLSDHNPNVAGTQPGLWDATTNDYTLGPDLDPYLFLRYARTIIENGSLPPVDYMRNVPLGFDTARELQMVSYMIVGTYRLINIFGDYSVNYAGAFMPVLFFAFTIIAFFLFVKEIFIRKNDKKSYLKGNIISLVATLFMIIIPAFLSRTVAGIPEKESIAFFFMFLAFYLFLKSWKSEKIIASSIFAVFAGISTGLMGLSWGGVTYVYITLGVASLIAFILNKFNTKEYLSYGLWLISSLVILFTFTDKFDPINFITSIDTGLASLTLGVILIHILLWKTKLNEIIGIDKLNIPKTILSGIIGILLGLLIILVINPSLIVEKATSLYQTLIKPVTGRWNTTVAENRQPYFTEWVSSFASGGYGLTFFWLFFLGSVLLFKNMFTKIKRNEAWILTGLYVFFFLGLVFSRYASHPAVLDGEGFLSKLFYFGSALLLIAGFIYYYIKNHKEKVDSFETMDYEYIMIFVLFILTLFTARGAVRLIMVLIPIAPIFFSYLIVETGFSFKNFNDKTIKVIIILLFACLLLFGAVKAVGFYRDITQQSYNFIPNYYTLQWQEAMSWVRENTSESSVFAHWWDYGYWVQSIGNRATITDGGNAIVWWNYFMGRIVLTGDNQKDALDFLHTHNASYLIIDPTDIGKYGAFSQIGSDKDYDRLSQGPLTFLADTKNSQETKEGVSLIYSLPNGGGYGIEEDISFDNNGTKVQLFQEKTGIAGVIVDYSGKDDSIVFKQPKAVLFSNNQRIMVPMRYLYFNEKLYDFKTGINATASIIPRVSSSANGMQINPFGAMLYLSPRIMRGLLGQVYVLNDPLKNFQNLKLVHSEEDVFTENFNQQGANLKEFIFYDNYGGLQGPIKIWKIDYTGREEYKEEYLAKLPPDYITWKF